MSTSRFERHALDPIALVGGVLSIVGGVIALLHQSGAIRLGPAPTILLVLVAAGLGAAALLVLMQRKPSTEPHIPAPPRDAVPQDDTPV